VFGGRTPEILPSAEFDQLAGLFASAQAASSAVLPRRGAAPAENRPGGASAARRDREIWIGTARGQRT
jgi:hypothetical protein